MKTWWTKNENRPVLAAALIAACLTLIAAFLGRAYLEQKALRTEAAASATRAESAAKAARLEANKGERAREQAQDLVRFIMRDLSEALVPIGQSEVLESVSKQTLAYFENLPPDLVTPDTEEQKAEVWLALGHARYRLGDLKGAIAADRKGIALLEKLALMEPNNPDRKEALSDARLDTAHVHTAAGRLDESRAIFRAVIESEKNPIYLAEAEAGLGEVEGIEENFQVSLQHCAKAILHAKNHLDKFPANIGARKILTLTHGNAGMFASNMGDQQLAEASYSDALTSARKLVALDPDNRNWDKELATLLNNFGIALEKQDRIDEAADFFNEALALRQSLVDWDPNNTRWLLNLANSWHNDAAIHYHRKKAPDTLASAQKALAIFQRLLTLQPENTAWLDEMMEVFEIQRDRLLELEAPDSALALSNETTTFVKNLKGGNLEDFAMTKALADLHRQVGKIKEDQGQSPIEPLILATQAFVTEVEADPTDEEKLTLLVQSYLDLAQATAAPDSAPIFALARLVLTDFIKTDSTRLKRLRDFSQREAILALGKHPPLLPTGVIWHYHDDRQAPPYGWHLPAFDSSTWKKGPAPLGYGDGAEATEINYGSDPRDKRITSWFRHQFQLKEVPGTILLNLRRDDGAIVFLNGKEVLRSGLPEGKTTPETFATNVAMGFDERVFHSHLISNHHLVSGKNTIAVELHQNEPQSSDLYLDLEIHNPATLPDINSLATPEALENLPLPKHIRTSLR
ncbi:MAG: tetratricopeptide repeat protein [Akkermansiaceae bacterium]